MSIHTYMYMHTNTHSIVELWWHEQHPSDVLEHTDTSFLRLKECFTLHVRDKTVEKDGMVMSDK